MAIIRVEKNKENPYVMLNKTALHDDKLSFKAKGIFSYLMGQPDNWVCKVEDLKNHAIDGRDSIYSGLKELRKHGYMIKKPIKNDKGIIVEWSETLFETPQEEAKEVFKEQKEVYEKAAVKRAETIKNKNEKTPLTENPHKENSTYGKSSIGESTKGEAVNLINNKLLNNNKINNDITSSCSSDGDTTMEKELVESFIGSICELKRTTLPKFINLIKGKDSTFIKTLIEYCEEINILSFAGFKTVLEKCLVKNILTAEAFIKSINDHRKNKEKKMLNKSMNKNKIKNNTKSLQFTNYEQRTYDYDVLENQLLGWA